jgi:uncharacterized protein (DUF2384 family)
METPELPGKSYRPTSTGSNSELSLVFGAIPAKLFGNPRAFIEAVRVGIPGAWLESTVNETGHIDIFVSALQLSVEKLKLGFNKEALDQRSSEIILDVVRLLMLCEGVWESRELAMRWLNNTVPALGDVEPVTLLDTYEGRRWVSQVLAQIEQGQFC